MKLKLSSFKFNYTYVLLALLALVFVLFSATVGRTFLRVEVWLAMARQFPEFGVMTMAVMLCFIIGKIDVSFVALGNFSAVVAILFVTQHLGLTEGMGATWLIILIALAIGALCGFLNGTLISRLNIPPILATLSTHMVFRGITVGVTGGHAVSGLPAEFASMIRQTSILGLRAVPFLVFLAIFLFVAYLLKFTTFGKTLYMMGSNPKAVMFSAINTTKITTLTFTLAGVITTIGTILMVAGLNSSRADHGASYLMRVILILVLAGVLPIGGMGKVRNVLLAIVIIQVISSGVNMFPSLNVFYRELISAALLLVVLVVTSIMLNSEDKKKKRKQREGKNPTPT